MPLGNPSVTSPPQGDRTRARNPRDITGTKAAQLLKDKQAREELANLDIHAIRHDAYTKGRADGFTAGFEQGWDSLAAHLVEIGILDPDDEPEVLGSPEAE